MPLSSFTAGSRETQLRCPRTFWRNSPNRRRQRCQARSCSRSSRGRSKSFGTYPPGLDRTEDERVPSQLVLIASFIVALVLFAFAARESLVRWLSGRSVILAALPLLNAVLLTLYVFGEDSYRGNGISRWDAYRSPGGALGPMYVLSVALMAACAALLLYAGRRYRHGLFRVSALVGGLTALTLVTPTILGFTLN
jgi:hypothetical protein